MNRIERLLSLLIWFLNADKPVPWQEVEGQFKAYAQGKEESSRRKFERDKAELASLGIPIAYQEGGYIIEKDKLFSPEVEFTLRESSLLTLSASAVLESRASLPYADQLESALRKVTGARSRLPSPAQGSLAIHAGPSGPRSRARWVRQVQDALERRKTLEIRYCAFSASKATRRAVDPYGLVFRKGGWALVGWDRLRKAVRSFALARIRDLKVNPRRPATPDYEVPEGFDLSEHHCARDWQRRTHGPIEAIVRVSPHRLPELAPQLEGAGARHLGGGAFRLQATDKDGLLRWVLFQKADAQIVEPPELREEVRRRMGAIAGWAAQGGGPEPQAGEGRS